MTNKPNDQKFPLIAAVALALISTTVSGFAQAERVQNDNSDVVARVGDSKITGNLVRSRARMIAASPQTDNDTDLQSLHRRALQQVIRETVLLNAADAEGLSISDEDLTRGIREMQSAALTSEDPAVRTAFEQAAVRLGVATDQFATEPRALATYRRLWKLAAIRSRIVENLSTGDRNDPAKVEEAIGHFVSQWKEDIVVLPAALRLTGKSK